MTTSRQTPPPEGLAATNGSLTVAFDIDNTWTLAPTLFRRVAHIFDQAGWKVIIVTAADQPEPKLIMLGIYGQYPVIVSRWRLKEQAAREAGHNVNVWIDDMPGMIQDCRILQGDLDSGNTEASQRRKKKSNPKKP